MTNIHVKVPHTLANQVAKDRITMFFDQTQKQFGAQVDSLTRNWEGDTCSFEVSGKGMKVAGTIEIHDKDVELKSRLPLAAFVFKGKIESALQEGLGTLLK